MVTYWRKGYTKSDGTRVKGTWVKIKTSGRSRGRSTDGRYSASKGYSRWITHKGKLGGPGYLSKSSSTRHKLLSKCVSEYGYRSCLGSVMVLTRNRSVNKKHGHVLNADIEWLKKKYSKSSHRKSAKKSRKSRVPCKSGQVRNLSTGRCRNKSVRRKSARKSRAPCKAGKVRDHSTGRCRARR